MKSFLAKAAVLTVLGAASVGAAFADASTSKGPIGNDPYVYSCPSVATLNNILKTQGPSGLVKFQDQGFLWQSTAMVMPLGAQFDFFMTAMIPTKSYTISGLMMCQYNVKTNMSAPNNEFQMTFYDKFTPESGTIFKGETGNWANYKPLGICTSGRADGCTFVRDLVGSTNS